MDRVQISDDLNFSRLVYGMWRIGDDTNTSVGYVKAKIHACLDQGITTFDQADIYGGYKAESLLGEILKADHGLIGKMEIVTKCDIVAPVGRYADAPIKYYDTSRAHIEKSVENSLRDMAIEQIDLLLIHRPDPFMDHYETGAVLDDLVASGDNGTGGSGAGGGASSVASLEDHVSGGGGGTGVYGEGASGIASTDGWGGGGSGGEGGGTAHHGAPGGPPVANAPSSQDGGKYGGGGGGQSHNVSMGADAGDGAQGAVRIIWGSGRAFPSTKVSLADSLAGETEY